MAATVDTCLLTSSQQEREQRDLRKTDESLLNIAQRIQEYTDDYVRIKVVPKLADKYGFDYQGAIRFLRAETTEEIQELAVNILCSVAPEPVKKTTKADKPIPLPFDPKHVVTVEQGGCQGLRTNHGLYTQCEGKLASSESNIYCKVCLKQMDKNAHGKPTAGTVADRLACKDLLAYTAPDGKRGVLPYGKVCQLLSIDQDLAVAEAYKAGVTIADEQWVIKSKGKGKGKGKKSTKTAAVTDSESESNENASSPKQQKKARKHKPKKTDTESELIAELVKQTSVTEIPTLLVKVGEELSETCTVTPAPSPSTKAKKEKKKKDSNAPKRAPSAYNLFIQDKENRAKYADVSAKEIMSKLSADWKTLNETDKKMWTEKAAARKAQMTAAVVPAPVVETPLPTPAPVVETPLPTPAPVVETPLPTRIVEGFEHVKQDFPELELEEYLGTCVTDGEEMEDEENVVTETPINKDNKGLIHNEKNELAGDQPMVFGAVPPVKLARMAGVTIDEYVGMLSKAGLNLNAILAEPGIDTEEALVYDKNDKLVKVCDWINSDEVNDLIGEDTEDEDEGDVVIETLIYKGVTYYKDSEGLVYDGDDTQVGVWDPVTEEVEFLYG